MMRKRGFTLIELLIVVAIIAILAAIAIPNFLEAQIRAKVANAYADTKAVGTALEAFSLDRAFYPPGYFAQRAFGGAAGYDADYRMDLPGYPKVEEIAGNASGIGGGWIWCWRAVRDLTTPVPYLATVLYDPFSGGKTVMIWDAGPEQQTPERIPYYYDSWQPWPMWFGTNGKYGGGTTDGYAGISEAMAAGNGYVWNVASMGPLRRLCNMRYVNCGYFPASGVLDLTNVTAREYDWFPYDASNGATSRGFVARTNKGMYTEMPPVGSPYVEP